MFENFRDLKRGHLSKKIFEKKNSGWIKNFWRAQISNRTHRNFRTSSNLNLLEVKIRRKFVESLKFARKVPVAKVRNQKLVRFSCLSTNLQIAGKSRKQSNKLANFHSGNFFPLLITEKHLQLKPISQENPQKSIFPEIIRQTRCSVSPLSNFPGRPEEINIRRVKNHARHDFRISWLIFNVEIGPNSG